MIHTCMHVTKYCEYLHSRVPLLNVLLLALFNKLMKYVYSPDVEHT